MAHPNLTDFNNIAGIAYDEVDKDEKFEYSVVRSVLFSKVYEVRITPNPASSFVNIYIAKKASVITQIIITDANANVVEKYNTPDQTKQINIGKYAKGVYFIKTITAENVNTPKNNNAVKKMNPAKKAPGVPGFFLI